MSLISLVVRKLDGQHDYQFFLDLRSCIKRMFLSISSYNYNLPKSIPIYF